jgi:hypothetical protein
MNAVARVVAAGVVIAPLAGTALPVAAGHGTGPPAPTLTAGPPLTHCRPRHLAAEPSPFRPGEAARRFRFFVDGECGAAPEAVTLEVWHRALYYDGEQRMAFGTPSLVHTIQTTTDRVQPAAAGATLKRFDVPADGVVLHPGCYVGRVRIGGRVGDVEACALPPRPGLPDPVSPPATQTR